MKLSVLAIFVALFSLGAAAPVQAHPRDGLLFGLGVGLGLGYGLPYYPYYPAYYYGYPAYYGYPTYYYPSAASYPPPDAETYYAPSPPQQAPAEQVQQPSYDGQQAGTCRRFQSTMDGALVTGTACLQPDGTWRAVGE